MFIVPVIHPAFTFRQPMTLGPLSAHVDGFVKRLVTGLGTPPRLLTNPSWEVMRDFIGTARTQRIPAAIDVECGEYGLLPGFAHLTAIGVGIAAGPGLGLSWSWPTHPKTKLLFRDLLADPSIIKVFMNGYSYDIPVLTRYGFKVAGVIHDIRDARRALSSTSKLSLAQQASMYLQCRPWKAEAQEDEDDEKGFIDPSRVKGDTLLRYNAEDAVRTAQIRMKQRNELRDEDERCHRIYRQQLRLSQVGSEMHLRGFPFDRGMARTLRISLRRIFKREQRELARLLRRRAPNFRVSEKGGVNDADLKALIYKRCSKPGIKSFGLEVPLSEKCWTESGQPGVGKDALLTLMSLDSTPDELKAVIRQCWKVDAPLKLISTYIDSSLVTAAIGPDGRLHAKVNTAGTETYRWSCSKPNLFNLPEAQDEDEGSLRGTLPNIRALYVAPPGFTIVHRDFKQLELEVMAEYTGDVLLRRMLDTGDAHTARVREWFHVPEPTPVPRALRRQGKVVGFASQYGGGVETVYTKVLEQIQDAVFSDVQQLWLTFRERHVQIAEHWRESVRYAEEHGYNETAIMGYRRYYPPGLALKPTECSNYAIQGTAAAIANSVMVGIDNDWQDSLFFTLKRDYPTAWLAMHTYDSFDVICEEQHAKDIDQLLDEKMRGPWKVGPAPKVFLSDGKTGTRWSEV